MRIGHIELFTRDIGAAREFYEDVLGAELVEEQADGRVLWYKIGQMQIMLRPGNPGESLEVYKLARSGIVLYTDDLDAEVLRLKRRGLAFEGDDGPGCPTFRDPDGNWFQLVNPAHQ